MTEERESGWTLLLLRRGGVRALTLDLEDVSVWGGALAGLAVVLLIGGGLGYLWASHQESRQVRTLQAEVQRLAEERSSVLQLASRLDSIEKGYRRLRRAMGGDVAAAERDVRLPPASPEPSRRERARTEGEHSWPLAQRGFITRAFGEGAGERSEVHGGLDIAVPSGSYVRASRAGRVIAAGDDPVYGRHVRIDHGEATTTLYGHASWLFVAPGDPVERDQVIALSGSSGRSTAPHLHFELTRDGEPIDPRAFFGAR